MIDHIEYEINWCCCTAEKIALTASRYSENPTKADYQLLDALYERMKREIRLPWRLRLRGKMGSSSLALKRVYPTRKFCHPSVFPSSR